MYYAGTAGSAWRWGAGPIIHGASLRVRWDGRDRIAPAATGPPRPPLCGACGRYTATRAAGGARFPLRLCCRSSSASVTLLSRLPMARQPSLLRPYDRSFVPTHLHLPFIVPFHHPFPHVPFRPLGLTRSPLLLPCATRRSLRRLARSFLRSLFAGPQASALPRFFFANFLCRRTSAAWGRIIASLFVIRPATLPSTCSVPSRPRRRATSTPRVARLTRTPLLRRARVSPRRHLMTASSWRGSSKTKTLLPARELRPATTILRARPSDIHGVVASFTSPGSDARSLCMCCRSRLTCRASRSPWRRRLSLHSAFGWSRPSSAWPLHRRLRVSYGALRRRLSRKHCLAAGSPSCNTASSPRRPLPASAVPPRYATKRMRHGQQHVRSSFRRAAYLARATSTLWMRCSRTSTLQPFSSETRTRRPATLRTLPGGSMRLVLASVLTRRCAPFSSLLRACPWRTPADTSSGVAATSSRSSHAFAASRRQRGTSWAVGLAPLDTTLLLLVQLSGRMLAPHAYRICTAVRSSSLSLLPSSSARSAHARICFAPDRRHTCRCMVSMVSFGNEC